MPTTEGNETRYTQAEQGTYISGETAVATVPQSIVTSKTSSTGTGKIYHWWPNSANGVKGEARTRS